MEANQKKIKRQKVFLRNLNEKLGTCTLASFSFSRNPHMRNILDKNLANSDDKSSNYYPSNIFLKNLKPDIANVTNSKDQHTYSRHVSISDLSNGKMKSPFKSVPSFDSNKSVPNEVDLQKDIKLYVARHTHFKLRDFIMINQLKNANESNDKILNMSFKKTFSFNQSDADSVRKSSEMSAKSNKFKKTVRKIVNALKVFLVYRISVKKLQNFDPHKTILEGFNTNMNVLFNKEQFSRPKEPLFPDEAKRMLQLEPRERTKEIIHYITISLIFSVPEFLQFPLKMQKRISSFARYQEFEPSRVILRQGHRPVYYYMIISGNAIVIEATPDKKSGDLIYSPKSSLKRGDCFGDKALIHNTRRTSTVTAYGNRPLCLLVIEREDFFRIQAPISTLAERQEFLKNKVNDFKIIGYPAELLNKIDKKYFFSIYYTAGKVICEDSSQDKWLYIIKSGACRVLKKVRFDEVAFDYYKNESKSRRKIITNSNAKSYPYIEKPVEYLPFGSSFVKLSNGYFDKNEYPSDSDNVKYTYLEMRKLLSGDVFGLQDLEFTEEKEINKLTLVSDGAECILVDRIQFQKSLPAESILKLKFSLQPYPNDETFIKKYFRNLDWNKFKNKILNKTINKSIEIKN